ncbi:hypothetical protein LBMAG34_0250 [Candidatus Saccharibacteria bacterium]|nr:hypothetical protein LBMAG34_0250 [Candidatus Saccharibacteria bacterium]
MGQNISILDGKLLLEANKWLVPIADAYPALEKEFIKVRTGNYRY